jgi:hypothetical protein
MAGVADLWRDYPCGREAKAVRRGRLKTVRRLIAMAEEIITANDGRAPATSACCNPGHS